MISNIVVNAALLTPYEPLTISFKYKNDLGRKITKMVLRAIVKRSSFSGETGSDLEIPLHSFLGTSAIDGETVNLAAGKSKTFTATFDIPGTVEFYFSEYPNARAVPVHVNGTASFSDGTAIGIDYEISDLKILNHRFTPQITEMNLVRAADGLPNDEGENVLTTLNFSVNNTEGYDYTKFFTARMYQSQGDEATETDEYIDLTSSITALLSGVTNDADILPGTYDKAYDWDFLLAFGDEYEMFYGRFNLGRAFANMHLSGKSTGGACFGGFSTSKLNNPKLESYYPFYAYGGIKEIGEGWTYLTPTNGTTPADYGGGLLRCRKIENKCIVDGSLLVKPGGDTIVLAELPDGYTPEKGVFSINACSGGRVARVVVGGASEENAGKLCLSWVKNLSDGGNYTAAAIWVQCSIEYWVEAVEETITYDSDLLDATGAAVIDADGNGIALASADGDAYQSRYTGAQIDAGIAAANNALSRSGGTMTGPLVLSGDPAEASHAATKRYVDNIAGNIQLTPGKSAYEIAVDEGFDGDEAAWLESLQGTDGKSAYSYAQDGGYTGTEAEFAEALGKIGETTEADSVSWNNIPDKPFGLLITGTAVPDGDTLSWNGNTAQTPINSGLRYFVSENVPTMDEINAGYSYAVKVSGSDTELDRSYITPTEYENYIFFGNLDGAYIYIVKTPNADGTTAFDRAGIYFVNAYGVYTSRLTINGYTFTASSEIAPISEKYIPGSIARQSAIDAMFTTTSGKIEWNGTIGDREVATNLDGALDGDTYVRVSETFIYPDELYAGGCKVYTNGSLSGTEYAEADAQAMITDFTDSAGVKVFWFSPGVYSVMYTDGGATIPNLRSFPKPGVYFRISTDGSYVSKLESSGISKLMTDTRLNTDLLPTISSFIMETAGGKKFRITIDANGNFVPTEL